MSTFGDTVLEVNFFRRSRLRYMMSSDSVGEFNGVLCSRAHRALKQRCKTINISRSYGRLEILYLNLWTRSSEHARVSHATLDPGPC